jgi:hypothetical protein
MVGAGARPGARQSAGATTTAIQAQISPAGGNGFREGFKTLVYEAIESRR